jgi:hypothetical protein
MDGPPPGTSKSRGPDGAAAGPRPYRGGAKRKRARLRKGKRGVIRISQEAIEEYRRAREVAVRDESPASPPRKKVKLRHLKLPS